MSVQITSPKQQVRSKVQQLNSKEPNSFSTPSQS